MSAHPWMKFYPRDWRGDQALRAVSIAARGLWMEMLCIMHEASPYGHLVLGGQGVSNDVLARMAGTGVDEVSALLIELKNAEVLSLTRKGIIYSRRMIKDRYRSETGRKSVSKRYSQGAENLREKPLPSRSPSRLPTTQKPEARSQSMLKHAAREPVDIPSLMLSLHKAAGIMPPDPGRNFARHSEAIQVVAGWIEAGADPVIAEQCVAARAAVMNKKARSLAYFDQPVRDTISEKAKQSTQSDQMIARIMSGRRVA